MDRARTSGGMAAEGGWARRVHARGISAKQRLHLAAFLILLAAIPLQAQSDIELDPAITQEEFETFSRLVAQSIYATPVDPARARGLLGFDIGVAVTAVPVDTSSPYWQHAVGNDFTLNDYVAVPRIVFSKGLSVATLSAMYSKVPDSDITVWGGALDVPILSGGVLSPTLGVRGSYSILQGSDEFDLTTYGAEVFLSKGFGPVTPYVGAGITRSDAEGRISPTILLQDESRGSRVTVGLKLTLLIPKIVIEATQAEERSYAAKVSFGL